MANRRDPEIDTDASTALERPVADDGVDSLDREASMDSMADAVRAPAVRPPPGRGTELGRYLVLDKIGEGGLGVVLSAYDPQLERKVAIKILRRETRALAASTRARERSLREARALARVVHPNIVAIHDAGLLADELYVVMELVVGTDLKAWLRTEERTLDAILDVFVQAGEGLAAAHAAGLIHRDFKPANVLVGADGRVRVADFGLARVLEGPASVDSMPDMQIDHAGLAAPPDGQSPPGPTPPRLDLRTDLTQTGAFVGTPGYMAPEQIDARALDERADVFAYCVALWEALYDAPPFGGEVLSERRAAIAAGPPKERPESRDVPGWLRELVVSGLAERPSARPQSMRAILDVIARRRRGPRRGAIAIAFGALGLVAVGGVALALTRDAAPTPCGTSAAELAQAWSAPQASAIGKGFAGLGDAAAKAWPPVRARLDAYATSWVRGHRAACEATRVAGTQSEQVLDRRMACYGRALTRLAAVARFFEHGGVDAAARSHEALATLPAIADCANTSLGASYASPDDPALAEEVKALQAQVSELGIASLEGRSAQRHDAEIALARAKELGWTPLIVDAAAVLGSIAEVDDDPVAARDAYREAAVGAIAMGDDQVAATTTASLAGALGASGELNAALAWLDIAVALSKRASMTQDTLLRVVANQADVLREAGQLDQALIAAEQAVEIARSIDGGEAEEVATAMQNLVIVQIARGEHSKADATTRALLALSARLGADHPRHAERLRNAAVIDVEQGRIDDAIAHNREALAIFERWYGEDHRSIDRTLNNLAGALRLNGEIAEARALFERLQRAYAARHGEASVENGQAEANLALMELEAGELDTAATRADRALAALEGALGPRHPELITALVIAGGIARYRGQLEASARHLARAVELGDAALGPSHAGTVNPRIERAATALAANDAETAVAVMSPAIGLVEHGADVAPPVAAEARFVMAQALRAAGRDAARARELATAARAGFAQLGEPYAAQRDAVDQWLSQR